MNSIIDAQANVSWQKFRSSQIWRLLRKVAFLRSGWYLALELERCLRASQTSSMQTVDGVFKDRLDPWDYETNPSEQERFAKQTEMLERVRKNGRPFQRGLEIGSAEGHYTEILAERCESLLVLDLSPTALARTQGRVRWPERVHFSLFDLRDDAIPGTFDLIVVAGVLEYFYRRSTMVKVRQKLVSALRPNGFLLVETTRAEPDVENVWWGRVLVRGKWINVFVSEHPSLITVSSMSSDFCSMVLCRKREPSHTQ